MLGGENDLKAEVEYELRRMEQEEERRRQEAVEAIEAAEQASDSNEARTDDERPNIPVLTTSPQEIYEQLQNLIVELSRCDTGPSRNSQPVV